MNESERTVLWSVNGNSEDYLPERLWTFEDPPDPGDDRAGDPLAGLVSLRFLKQALRRQARLWCAIALFGLVVGAGLYVKFPPAYTASTSVLVNDGTNVDPTVAITTDTALAQSRTVAAGAARQLGLSQSVESFQASYQVSAVTDQLLEFTVGAKTSADAVHRAAALASAFLQFRARYANIQQQQLATDLNQQVSQARKSTTSINNQITALTALPSTSARQSELNTLNQRSTAAAAAYGQVESYAGTTLAAGQVNTNDIIKDSQVIDGATIIPHSKLKGAGLDLAGGLIGGLAIGMGLVVVLALTSDRLRRRDDVALALGAPVQFSVGELAGGRWRPRLPGRGRRPNLNLRRVVAYLRSAVPGTAAGPATLAVVAVDNVEAAAPVVAALAISYAREGKRVILADLCPGAPAARLLGGGGAGTNTVSRNGVNLIVTVPAAQDAAPAGPLDHGTLPPATAEPEQDLLAETCAAAEVLLTLAALDPAYGGQHLSTWAGDAVALVTAGKSSAVRINAVGEMIRLAGTRLVSAVLIGADRHDESIGVIRPAEQAMPVSGPVSGY